ncbi:hypothetical protein ACP4OV_031640 [Aristida adscensionis]
MPRHAHHDPPPPACCAGCCGCAPAPAPAATCCCYYPAPAPSPAPPSSSSAASDHLLHAIAAHLLLSSPPPQPPPQAQPQPQYPQPPPPPPPPAAHHATDPYAPYPYALHYPYQYQQVKPHAYAQPPPPPPPPQQQRQQLNPPEHGHLLLHSLLRRVAALESALPRHAPSRPPAWRPPHPVPRPRRAARGWEVEDDDDDTEEEEEQQDIPPPRRPPQRARGGRPPAGAARERAARTIQAHFRRFLARRSRTLRQLKELAVLRSKAAALRGSLSGRRGCADPAAVSGAAMGVLLRLDAIQGGDPMIREGKRAVSREVTRILEFVDKVLVKEHEQMAMGAALDTDEYHEGCNASFVANRPAVSKKKVSFSANGQVHELHGEADNGNVVVDEESESSSSAESDEAKGMPGKRSANGKPGLAAPVPVHMESRRIAGERR